MSGTNPRAYYAVITEQSMNLSGFMAAGLQQNIAIVQISSKTVKSPAAPVLTYALCRVAGPPAQIQDHGHAAAFFAPVA